MEGEEDETCCRICRGGEEADLGPLFYPCKCSGSIKHVHQPCLIEWLKHSGNTYCEVCKHKFQFTRVYAKDAPATLPWPELVVGVVNRAARSVRVLYRVWLVACVWLGIVPLVTSLALRVAFAPSLAEVPALLLPRATPLGVATDCLQGCALSVLIVFLNIGFNSLREYLRTCIRSFEQQLVQATAAAAAAAAGPLVAAAVQAPPGDPAVLPPLLLPTAYQQDIARPGQRGGQPDTGRGEGQGAGHEGTATVAALAVLHAQPGRVLDPAVGSRAAGETDGLLPSSAAEQAAEGSAVTGQPAGDAACPAVGIPPPSAGSTQVAAGIEQRDAPAVTPPAATAHAAEAAPYRAPAAVAVGMAPPLPLAAAALAPPMDGDVPDVIPLAGQHEGDAGPEVPFEEMIGLQGGWSSFFETVSLVLVGNIIFMFAVVYFPLTLGRYGLVVWEASPQAAFALQSVAPTSFGGGVAGKGSSASPVRVLTHLLGMQWPLPWGVAGNAAAAAAADVAGPGAVTLALVANSSLEDVVQAASGNTVFGGTQPLPVTAISLDQVMRDLQSHVALPGRRDMLALCLGHGTLSFMAFLLLWVYVCVRLWRAQRRPNRRHLHLSRQSFRQVLYAAMGWAAAMVQQLLKNAQLGTLLLVEVGLFPLLCGMWLDVCALPITRSGTVAVSHIMLGWLTAEASLFGLFLHWAQGAAFMLAFTFVVYLTRDVLRPGALPFLKDPTDPERNPLREMMEGPLVGHISRCFVTGAIYAGLAVVFVHLPALLSRRLAPGLFPLRVLLFDPLTQIPADMLLFHICIPFMIEHLQVRAILRASIRTWLRYVGRLLGLEHYLLLPDPSVQPGPAPRPWPPAVQGGEQIRVQQARQDLAEMVQEQDRQQVDCLQGQGQDELQLGWQMPQQHMQQEQTCNVRQLQQTVAQQRGLANLRLLAVGASAPLLPEPVTEIVTLNEALSAIRQLQWKLQELLQQGGGPHLNGSDITPTIGCQPLQLLNVLQAEAAASASQRVLASPSSDGSLTAEGVEGAQAVGTAVFAQMVATAAQQQLDQLDAQLSWKCSLQYLLQLVADAVEPVKLAGFDQLRGVLEEQLPVQQDSLQFLSEALRDYKAAAPAVGSGDKAVPAAVEGRLTLALQRSSANLAHCVLDRRLSAAAAAVLLGSGAATTATAARHLSSAAAVPEQTEASAPLDLLGPGAGIEASVPLLQNAPVHASCVAGPSQPRLLTRQPLTGSSRSHHGSLPSLSGHPIGSLPSLSAAAIGVVAPPTAHGSTSSVPPSPAAQASPSPEHALASTIVDMWHSQHPEQLLDAWRVSICATVGVSGSHRYSNDSTGSDLNFWLAGNNSHSFGSEADNNGDEGGMPSSAGGAPGGAAAGIATEPLDAFGVHPHLPAAADRRLRQGQISEAGVAGAFAAGALPPAALQAPHTFERQHLFLCKLLLMGGLWAASVVVVATAAFTLPVLIGRALFEHVLHYPLKNDLYTGVIGFMLLWLACRAVAVLRSATSTRTMLIGLHSALKWAQLVVKCGTLAIMWLGVVATLAGLLIELVLLPLRLSPHETALIFFYQDWVVGVLALKLWHLLLMVRHRRVGNGALPADPHGWHVQLEALQQNGVRQLDFQAMMRLMVIPAVVNLGTILCLPYVISRGLLPQLPFVPAAVLRYGSLYAHTAAVGLYIACHSIWAFHAWILRLHNDIRDDRYLVGRELNNFEGEQRRAREQAEQQLSAGVVMQQVD